MLAFGCTTDPGAAEHQGVAALGVDTAAFAAVDITRVTVTGPGTAQDLTRNDQSGRFEGTLILPIGMQSLIARAFAGDTLVGESAATPVDIHDGTVTQVEIRILDRTTGQQPSFGPIFDSLSHPMTIPVGAMATFAISVVAPSGAAVTYEWTDDCADSLFAAPQAAVTGWATQTPGACTITVVATANGLTIAQSFPIVALPPGASNGAADITGVFVAAPRLSFGSSVLGCDVSSTTLSASCVLPIASPTVADFEARATIVSENANSTLEVTDNCGGEFGTTFANGERISGHWRPPVTAGVCVLTVRTVNADGIPGTLSVATLVRPGVPPVTQPPQITATLFGSRGACGLTTGTEIPCPAASPFGQLQLIGNVDWVDGLSGSVAVTGDCGVNPANSTGAQVFGAQWTVTGASFSMCTVTVTATNLRGVTGTAVAHYNISLF